MIIIATRTNGVWRVRTAAGAVGEGRTFGAALEAAWAVQS